MMNIKENKESLNVDVEICVDMVTFVALWKMKKFAEAGVYVENAAKNLNNVILGVHQSKMSRNSSQNLYCLIVMSLAGLKIKTNNDTRSAKIICEDCKGQLESNSLCHKLLLDFISKVNSKKLQEEDFLINEVYQRILFVTTFLPLIAPNTPLIKVSELEEEQIKFQNNIDPEKSVHSYRVNSSHERLDSSRISKRGVKSTPKNDFLFKPWWESNKILENSIGPDQKPESRNEKRYKSEPRKRQGSMHNETKTKYSPTLIPPSVLRPYPKENFFHKQIQQKKKNSIDHTTNKEIIMLEFNPEYEKSSGECQVQLIPLTIFNTRNNNSKHRPLSNFHLSRNSGQVI